MSRCRQCLSKVDPAAPRCPVCGIKPNKPTAELQPAEKQTRRHARGIRLLSLFHLLAAAAVLFAIPSFGKPIALLLLSSINLALGLGLARFAFWAYRAATAFYFLIGMVNVISIQHGTVYLGGIFAALTALYLVGNKTAKAIFERRAPVD